jgi:hypothetical protein
MSNTDTCSETVCDNAALESGQPDDGKHADTNIVDWDGPDDAANPVNWPSRKRWAHVIIVSILALVTYAFLVDGLVTYHPLTRSALLQEHGPHYVRARHQQSRR